MFLSSVRGRPSSITIITFFTLLAFFAIYDFGGLTFLWFHDQFSFIAALFVSFRTSIFLVFKGFVKNSFKSHYFFPLRVIYGPFFICNKVHVFCFNACNHFFIGIGLSAIIDIIFNALNVSLELFIDCSVPERKEI